jgi:hypothetical protein
MHEEVPEELKKFLRENHILLKLLIYESYLYKLLRYFKIIYIYHITVMQKLNNRLALFLHSLQIGRLIWRLHFSSCIHTLFYKGYE